MLSCSEARFLFTLVSRQSSLVLGSPGCGRETAGMKRRRRIRMALSKRPLMLRSLTGLRTIGCFAAAHAGWLAFERFRAGRLTIKARRRRSQPCDQGLLSLGADGRAEQGSKSCRLGRLCHLGARY